MIQSKHKELAKYAVSIATKNGANQASVSLTNQRRIKISHRKKRIEEISESTENSLFIEIYTNKRYSAHRTNDLNKQRLEKFIKEAVAATKYLSEDEFRSLPEPEYYPKDTNTDLNLYDDYYTSVKSTDRLQIAKQIEDLALGKNDKIISVNASYSDTLYSNYRIHSNGFEAGRDSTSFTVGASVTMKDDDARPADWSYATTRFYKQLPNAEHIASDAVQRTEKKIGQEKIASGDYLLLIENRAASRLLYMFYQPLSGRALQQKSSYLDGMKEKQIASEKLSVTDNPFIKKGLGSRLYDGDGLEAKKLEIIKNGILKNYYIDYYYSKKLKLPPTTGSSSNIEFQLGNKSLQQLINTMDKGILVTEFNGGNSNSTTGDFSYGITGQLIENGKIVKPVNELIISGNAINFWKNLVETGNDPYPYSSMLRPSLLFKDVSISGI